MSPLTLPSDFVLSNCQLSWQELVWGLDHELTTVDALIGSAVRHLERNVDVSAEEVRLAGLDARHAIDAVELARGLAGPETPALASRKWLHLVLKWSYEHRAELADPLGLVERIYSDFDYPDDIRHFVRYMPVSGGYDPTSHTRAENEARLYRLWREYIEATAGLCAHASAH